MRLHEKGGKRHEMPCHHNLDEYLHAYVDAAGIAGDDKEWLFRTTVGRSGALSERPMGQGDVYRMIGRRADVLSIAQSICRASHRLALG